MTFVDQKKKFIYVVHSYSIVYIQLVYDATYISYCNLLLAYDYAIT